MRHLRTIPLAAAIVVVFGLATGVAKGWAADDELPFDEAEIFFELNHTDGDLGIHALIDGEAWRRLTIEDPQGRKLLLALIVGRLRRQGLTELFFESAEPTFDELPPQEFFRRFPAGEYEIEGRTLEHEELESTAELTHTMPAPPAPTVNGSPMAVQCDEDEQDYDATPVEEGTPVIIAWPAVTMSHPDPAGGGAGVQPPIPVTIHNYEVVVEVELEVGGEEFASVFSVILPPDQTSMTIPAEFIALGEVFKYEVLAREESFNQTAVESCFVVVEAME